jgi:hypothetical protein
MRDARLEGIREIAHAELSRHPVARPWWTNGVVLVLVNVVATSAFVWALSREGVIRNASPVPLVLAVALAIAVVATVGAVMAIAPARRHGRSALLFFVAAVLIGVGFGGSGLTSHRTWLSAGLPCLFCELAMAVVPSIVALIVLFRFAYDPTRTLLAALAASATGAFALHLHCPIGTASHLFAFHVIPWVAVALVTVWLRSRLPSRSYVP